MKKELSEQIYEQGLKNAVDEYIQKREKQINRYWLSLWIFTAIIFIVAYCIKDFPTQQKPNDEQIEAFFQAKVDSLQHFVDTTLNIEAHVLDKINKK
jgi:hypothetical protein